MNDSQALEKIKLQFIRMIEISNGEILEGKKGINVDKVAFWEGAKYAMEQTLEMIYTDTIEL